MPIVAFTFPSRVLGLHGGNVREASSTEALSQQDAQLGLGHVERAAMPGGAMNVQARDQIAGFARREGLIERGRPCVFRLSIVLLPFDDSRGDPERLCHAGNVQSGPLGT